MPAVADALRDSHPGDSRSRQAAGMLDGLAALPRTRRRTALAALAGDPRHGARDLAALLAASQHHRGTPYALWQDDPVGFCTQVLGVDPWSLAARLLESSVDHPQTAVPSCFQSSKSHSAACRVLHHVLTHPPSIGRVVTTANSQRQVTGLLWADLKRIHEHAQLPGEVASATWRIANGRSEVLAAEGFSPSEGNESSYSGIHSPRLLWVVDEAGAFARPRMTALRGSLSGEHTRALFIGNPSTDETDTAFEVICNDPDVATITIPASATPNFTGETTAWCRLCPTAIGRHRVAEHLVDRGWEAKTRRDFGEASAFYTAKALARFPDDVTDAVIQSSWAHDAQDRAQQADPDGVDRLSVSPTGVPYVRQPRAGAWVRLGVDVAAGGGDRLSISRAEGDPTTSLIVRQRMSRAGAANADSVEVAGVVLREIHAAQQLAAALGTVQRIQVKVDVIGVGWGVYGLLAAWGRDGRHTADIVAVDVRQLPEPGRREAADLRPARKRDELWLTGRALLQPSEGAEPRVALDVDDRTRAQWSAPRSTTNEDGLTVIESKDSMRRRGISSPDDAESGLLSVYEPVPLGEVRRYRRVRSS